MALSMHALAVWVISSETDQSINQVISGALPLTPMTSQFTYYLNKQTHLFQSNNMHSNHIDKLNFGSQMKKKTFFWKMPNEENDAAGDISISHDMSSTKKIMRQGIFLVASRDPRREKY